MVVVMAPDATQQDMDGIVELVRGAGGRRSSPAACPAPSSAWSATWTSSARSTCAACRE